MIIEIKDLPSDRKVKHITFDITFEEDGSPIIKSSPSYSPIQPSPVYGPISPQPVDPLGPPWTVTCDASANVPVTQREHKDIPPEMTNVEF